MKCDSCDFETDILLAMANHLVKSHAKNLPSQGPKYEMASKKTISRIVRAKSTRRNKGLIYEKQIKTSITKVVKPKAKIVKSKAKKSGGQWRGPERKFKCEQCDFSSNFTQMLANHKVICSGPASQFSCQLCEFKSNASRNVTRHYIAEHSKNGPKVTQLKKCFVRLEKIEIPSRFMKGKLF